MGNNMETTVLYWGYIGVYIGMMENKNGNY